ncbi:MAG: hypothetical protein M0D54_19090 [Hyphomonadaceae bacterium JAD_PAG50586_4]|nr:MAG: hypothetical protein M0D54_19090 [Hyphomonadaceae bacterium JAD_PAG50586_4]
MAQPIFPDGVNAMGVAAVIAFLGCWIGAAFSALAMHRAGDMQYFDGSLNIWKHSEPRKRFLRVFASCAGGLLCALAAFTFGGWPTGR